MSTSDVKEILIGIYRAKGSLTPEILLDEARSRSHPLHSRFEWDDSAAAEKWRLAQSADIIRSVKIQYVSGDGSPHDLRAFHAVREDPSRPAEYKPTEDVLADPIAAEILKRQMRRDWATFEARYRHLLEFEQLIHEQAQRAV